MDAIQEAINDIDKYIAKLYNVPYNTLNILGEQNKTHVKETNIFKGNGPLRYNQNYRFMSVDSILIFNNTSYATYVEYGRGEVRPREKKVLHFKINGEDIFTMSAKATSPRPFFQNSIDYTNQNIDKVLMAQIDLALK